MAERNRVWACRGERRRGCAGGARTEVIDTVASGSAGVQKAIKALRASIGRIEHKVEKIDHKVTHAKQLKGKSKKKGRK